MEMHHFRMETPLCGRSGGHIGAAPTIPSTHRRSAKVKIKVLTLAELPQMAKYKKWRLHSLCKWQNAKKNACIAYANGKTQKMVLA